MLLHLLNKIERNYKAGGLKQVFIRGIKKIQYLIFHSNHAYWYRNDLNNLYTPKNRVNEDISVDFDQPHETIEYIKNFGYFYHKEIEIGLKEGHMYTSLKLHNRTIGYNKTGFNNVYIEDFKKVYRFPPGVAFTYDTYIDPNYRNKGYGAYLLYNVCTYLKSKGFRSIWAHIPPWNKASIVMHEKTGFQKKEYIAYFWVIGFDWNTIDPVELIKSFES